jgi:ATP-dependent DNA helicase RecQ
VTTDSSSTHVTPRQRAALADLALSDVLRRMAGDAATPKSDQVAAVRALVVPGSRVLVVQATGWGKSAVYWAATCEN